MDEPITYIRKKLEHLQELADSTTFPKVHQAIENALAEARRIEQERQSLTG